MTEEIIIDGVNVAGCKNYVHIEEKRYKPECNCSLTTVERGYYCDTYATSVCEEEDCDYKQIKRLEQENKELKEEKEKYKPFYELGAKCTQLNEVADSLNNLNSKYKSALEEIQELSNINKEGAVFMKPTYRLEKINKIVCEVLK